MLGSLTTEPTSYTTTDPPPHRHLFASLPTLQFDKSLGLVFCNEAAERLFPGLTRSPQLHASWFLQQDADAESRAKERLEAAAGSAVPTSEQADRDVEFWIGSKGQRQPLHYQSIVERTVDDGFALLLLRPSTFGSPASPPRSPSSASVTSFQATGSSTSSGSRRRNSLQTPHDRPSYEPIAKAITAGMPASQRPKINEDAPTRALDDILSKVVVAPSETVEAVEETREPPECKDLTPEEAEHMLEALPVVSLSLVLPALIQLTVHHCADVLRSFGARPYELVQRRVVSVGPVLRSSNLPAANVSPGTATRDSPLPIRSITRNGPLSFIPRIWSTSCRSGPRVCALERLSE